MDYKRGFALLKECLEQKTPKSLSEFHTLEVRFNENERNERIYGSSENSRNERAQIIYNLNEFCLEHCGISFNELCQGKTPSKAYPIDEVPLGETPMISGDNKDPQYDYRGMEWYSPQAPKMKAENFEEFQARTNFKVDILLMTATERELSQVLRLLKPLYPMRKIRHITKRMQTYYVGKFAAFSTVVVKCEMGAVGQNAALHTTRDAIETWNPKALIMVGIAFGSDRSKHQPADILIAKKIVPYESQRVGEEIIFRSEIPSSGVILRNRFENALGWSFERPDGSGAKVHLGTILSGEALIDDPVFKQQLIEHFPEAIGGEMEGAGVYASASRENLEWILVKAVCDWADGRKHSGYQEMAAAAAASLTYFVLSNPDALDGL